MKKLTLLFLSLISLLAASEINVCFTGNNRGLLDPCGCSIPAGGYARIASTLNSIKGPHIQIGVGNHFFHHTPIPNEDQIFEQRKALLQAELMSELNYQVVNIGQFDLCYGLKPLLRIQQKYDLNLISANLLDTDGMQLFPSYKIIEHKGLKIMFIGICYLSDGFNFKISDPFQRLVDLKEEGVFEEADLIILLADAPAKMLSDFAKDHPGIDMIVASKDHMFTSLPVTYKKTAMVQLGSQGKYLGKMSINFKDIKNEWKNLSIYDYYVSSTESKLTDPNEHKQKIRRKLKSHKKKFKKQKNDHPEYYLWNMIFQDENIPDEVKIKDAVEALIERK